MSSVSDKDSGVVTEHITAVEQVMVQENSFIFLRPTEYDTTILIKEGYATKSMDIHDKSSNWGPMAGFVPCDPPFSKLATGEPNTAPHYHSHGAASPVQLFLSDSLLHTLEARCIDRVNDPTLSVNGEGRVEKQPRHAQPQKRGPTAEVRFYTVKGRPATGPKSTLFCLTRKAGTWVVSWVHWTTKQPTWRAGSLIPLYVWAYKAGGKLTPVTGDYDVWMVAPHISHFKSHVIVDPVLDIHGSSAASEYSTALMKTMNAACNRSESTVFNHGAEAQNYGFTQKLDGRVAMFTPSGQSRMVDIFDMPKVLADLQNGGYLVLANKRYGELDPVLMGKADPKVRGFAGTAGKILSRQRLLKALDEVKAQRAAGASDAAGKAGLAKAQWGLVRTAVKHNYEHSRISIFQQELTDNLARYATGPQFLSADDFPPTHRGLCQELVKLQRELQAVSVGAAKGGGESDASQVTTWMIEHAKELDVLLSSFSAA